MGGQQRGQAHGLPAVSPPVATGTLLGLLQVGWDGCGGAEPRPSQAAPADDGHSPASLPTTHRERR